VGSVIHVLWGPGWTCLPFTSGLLTGLVVVPDEEAVDTEALIREVEAARADLDGYEESDLAGVLGAEKFNAGIHKRAARLAEAERKLAEAGGPDNGEWRYDRGSVQNARALWNNVMADSQKREAVARLIDVIVVAQRRGKPIETPSW
jgi:hypothetical protein